MLAILRQASIRGVDDVGTSYRDYVLGTGRLNAVWELIDRAFALAGFELVWDLDGGDPLAWHATFADGENAVVVDPAFVRPADPLAIAADSTRIRDELGWEARGGLDTFLEDMLAAEPAAVGQ
jgi:GDPmannose 4,6-dehydratase